MGRRTDESLLQQSRIDEFDEPDALLNLADTRTYEAKERHHAAPAGDIAVLAAN